MGGGNRRAACSGRGKAERNQAALSRNPALSLAEKPELDLGETVADFFRRTGPEAQPFGHHRQIAAQFAVALLEMVPNFAALNRRNQGIGHPLPRDRLPVLQLSYFAAQDIRLSHAFRPAFEKVRIEP